MAKAMLFTNWTDEDFTYTWDGVEYDFKAGQSIYLQDYLAMHFANHLIDRELNKQKLVTSHQTRNELIRKCFGEIVQTIQADDKTKLETELLQQIGSKVPEPVETQPEIISGTIDLLSTSSPSAKLNVTYGDRAKRCPECDSPSRHKNTCSLRKK